MTDYNSSLPVRTETNGDVSVKVCDSNNTSQGLSVGADGSINVTDNGGSLTVDGTVELGASSLAALESMTIQNGPGVDAVNIQDGGNSITVDGSVTVSATDLDIRDLQHTSDSVKIGDGVDLLSINTDGSINVSVSGTTLIGDLNANKDDVAIAGTEDGNSTGVVRHFVNNRRQQILASHDRQQSISYSDFGTKDQRIVSVVYTSPTFPGISAVKTINYSLVGNRYRRDDIIWSII
jgi:hypothetical protein